MGTIILASTIGSIIGTLIGWNLGIAIYKLEKWFKGVNKTT